MKRLLNAVFARGVGFTITGEIMVTGIIVVITI
jgi:hypothetical protein